LPSTKNVSRKLTWLWKWIYNPATQVQIPTDADLSSYYYLKIKPCLSKHVAFFNILFNKGLTKIIYKKT
jgi:hypothetical protein